MNFAAHVLVAAEATRRPTTGLLVGAAAPDLARMARVPVAPTGPEDFVAGVALHHRTDAVFHELAWFRGHNRALVAELGRRGVRRGPARGAAHVLVELLLDGVLLSRPTHAETFSRPWSALGGPTPEALAMVSVEHQPTWRAFLHQLTSRLDPEAYAEARYAADRTAGTLARRPRLAMHDDEVATLREVADAARGSIAADADEVLRSVVAAI